MFSKNFLNISTPFGVKLYSWLQPPLWEKWCYNPVACSVCANLLGFSKEDWYDCLLLLNSNLFLLFFTAFHWNILTAITSRHMFWWIALMLNFIFKNIQGTLESISQMLETNKKLGQWNMIAGTAFSFEKVKDYEDIIYVRYEYFFFFLSFRYFKAKCGNFQHAFYGLIEPGICVNLSN